MFPLKDLMIRLKRVLRDELDIATNNIISKLADVESSICTTIDYAKDEIINRINQLEDTIRPVHTNIIYEEGIEIYPNDYYETKIDSLVNYDAAILTVKASYYENASNPVEVRWFYSPNDSDFETLEEILDKGQYVKLSVKPGEYAMRTIIIPAYEQSAKVQFLNLDPDYSVYVYYWIRLVRWLGLHKP